MAKYRLTSRARIDLRKIWDYTANEWSINQAEKYYDGLLSVFDAIANRVVEGKPADSIHPGLRRVTFVKHYIFFRKVDDVFEITRVLHVTMESKKHLKQ